MDVGGIRLSLKEAVVFDQEFSVAEDGIIKAAKEVKHVPCIPFGVVGGVVAEVPVIALIQHPVSGVRIIKSHG